MRTDRIEKVKEVLRHEFENGRGFDSDWQRYYRLEHSMRVANIGAYIARKEGMDEEEMICACLLHDAAYFRGFKDRQEWVDHGRNSAKIAKPVFESLGFTDSQVEEMCFGISTHVDEEKDFPRPWTVFERTIRNADDIDRYDVYRLYETLQMAHFEEMNLNNKILFLEKRIDLLSNHNPEPAMVTKTAQQLWEDHVAFQVNFLRRMVKQLDLGKEMPE